MARRDLSFGCRRHGELPDLFGASPRSFGIGPGRLGNLRVAIPDLAAMAPLRLAGGAGHRLRGPVRGLIMGVIFRPG